MVVTSGTCANPITDKETCETAAARLGRNDTNASIDSTDFDQYGTRFKPPYCFEMVTFPTWFGGQGTVSLMFNAGKNSGSCSSRKPCLCYAAATVLSSARRTRLLTHAVEEHRVQKERVTSQGTIDRSKVIYEGRCGADAGGYASSTRTEDLCYVCCSDGLRFALLCGAA